MTRPRNASPASNPPGSRKATTAAEPDGPPESVEASADPEISDARQLSRLINGSVTRSLRDLLETLIPQSGPGARACVATKGTVQHADGSDTTYVLDYEIHVHYKCMTPASSTEGNVE